MTHAEVAGLGRSAAESCGLNWISRVQSALIGQCDSPVDPLLFQLMRFRQACAVLPGAEATDDETGINLKRSEEIISLRLVTRDYTAPIPFQRPRTLLRIILPSDLSRSRISLFIEQSPMNYRTTRYIRTLPFYKSSDTNLSSVPSACQ